MPRLGRYALLAMIACALTACTYQQQFVKNKEIQSRARYAAVLPMVNLSTYPHAGRIVGDLLTTELYALSNFQLMESTLAINRFKGGAVELDDKLDTMVAQEAGERMGVDTIIYGSVSEYRYKRGLNEDPVVGINIRLLDVKTGKILWAGSKSKTGGCFWFCEDSLNRLAQQVVNELVVAMLSDEAE